MNHLYESHLGVDYQGALTRPETWSNILSVSSAEIWETSSAQGQDHPLCPKRNADMRARIGLPRLIRRPSILRP